MAKANRPSRNAGRFIKVETPETTDGVNLRYDNKKVVTRITLLPATAKAELERNQRILPEHLRSTITDLSKEQYDAEHKALQDAADEAAEETSEGSDGGDELDSLTKAELQERYEEALGEAPATSLTKAELIDAIKKG